MDVCYLWFVSLIVASAHAYLPRTHSHQRISKQSMLPQFVEYKWNRLEFGFKNENDKQSIIEAGQLLPGKGVPIDVQPYYDKNGKRKVFITIPRFETGIPYTLAIVADDDQTTRGPLLQPYPNIDWHNSRKASDCDKLTSVFRVAVTECDQMWVLDSGVIAGKQICPPQLLLIDLLTDQLLHAYRFDGSLYTPSVSLFVTPILHVSDPPPQGNCSQVMIYAADTTHHGLVVYDTQLDRAWRVENKFMYPDPDFGSHTLAGGQFTLMDGIIGMAVDNENLYFHAMASVTDYSVPLSVLNNEKIFANNVNAAEDQFEIVGKRPSACVPMALDSNSNMYCITFKPIELFVWNSQQKPYNQHNVQCIPLNNELYQFVSGLKIIKNPDGKNELWVLSNRLQLGLGAGGYNESEINFRILRLPCFDNSKRSN